MFLGKLSKQLHSGTFSFLKKKKKLKKRLFLATYLKLDAAYAREDTCFMF